MAQSCPGCPCGGFIPGAVAAGGVATGVCVGDGVLNVGAEVTAGAAAGGELSGAPTAISQRCPGWPCSGFMPAATGVAACGVTIC